MRIWLLMGVGLILLVGVSGCKKRTGRGDIHQVPTVSQPTPVETPPEPDPPDHPEVEVEAEVDPVPEAPSPPTWEAANLLFSGQDYQDACEAYSSLAPELPQEIWTRAILACAAGTPEQRRLAREWLEERLGMPESTESAALLRALEELLIQLQAENQKVAAQQRELKKLAEELEMLKKIDAQRRRP